MEFPVIDRMTWTDFRIWFKYENGWKDCFIAAFFLASAGGGLAMVMSDYGPWLFAAASFVSTIWLIYIASRGKRRK